MTLRRSPMPRQPRPKQCGNPDCRRQFTPRQMGQRCCCGRCERIHGAMERARRQERERADRKRRTKAELERLKTPQQKRSDALKKCQRAFNEFIRERDAGLPCISCGTTNPGGNPRGGVWDCGHYRTVGACPELRFEPLNAAKQCKQCNRDRSGHVVEYRIRLIERIGQEAVDWLEGPHEPRHWTVEQINDMAAEFRRRTREMQRGRGAA